MVELLRKTNQSLRNALNIQMVIRKPLKIETISSVTKNNVEMKTFRNSNQFKSKNVSRSRRRFALSAIMSGQIRFNVLLHKRETKLVKKVAWCVGLFSFSWFPYAIVVLIAQFYPENNFIGPLVTTIPSICAKTSVIFNPLLFTLINPEFKVFFKKTLGLKTEVTSNKTSSSN